MLGNSKAFSGFAVDDLEAAQRFYGETLEQQVVKNDDEELTLTLVGDRPTEIYLSPNVTPPSYTILNFPVEDVDAAVEWLSGRGVRIEHYEGMGQEPNGVLKDEKAEIAWFKDPAGNTLSVLKNK